jgi:lipopolysaccharide/colanic/teichoic acid biosynthesis glycosyltransferase
MNRILIRFFDFVFSLIGLVVCLPFFLVFACWIIMDSRGGVLFRQPRVGRYNKDFTLLKFRTMKVNSGSLLTVGENDQRITSSGRFLRKYKIDELPQLFNVLTGDMSLVGPRPEVRKYVQMYSQEQLKVLSVKPGITDYASIAYTDENAILGKAADPETAYIKEIMPHKILLNMQFIERPGLRNYFSIIFKTLQKLFSS